MNRKLPRIIITCKGAKLNERVLEIIRRNKENVVETTGKDYRSHLGQFAWTTLNNNVHFPYIFRNTNECFVSMRIVNQIIFPDLCNTLSQQFFDLFPIVCSSMTQSEAKLYNEINSVHCNSQYGLNTFDVNEMVASLSEVLRLFNFAYAIFQRIVQPPFKLPLNPDFGFVHFKAANIVVPFFKHVKFLLLPARFFQEHIEKLTVSKLSGFGYSVLVFLMKLQGIEVESGPLDVVPLTDLQHFIYGGKEIVTACWVPNEVCFYRNFTNPCKPSILVSLKSDNASIHN